MRSVVVLCIRMFNLMKVATATLLIEPRNKNGYINNLMHKSAELLTYQQQFSQEPNAR